MSDHWKTPHGVLVTNTTPAGAQWDVAKLQMFYFTLIVVIAYAVNLGTTMKSAKPVTSFPDLSEGLIALLGISHAGYLSSKAVTHSTTT